MKRQDKFNPFMRIGEINLREVTISVGNLKHVVQVENGTVEEMVTEAFETLYPNQEGKFEYTVIKRPVCTKEEAQNIIENVEKEIRKDFGMRGI